MLDDLQLSSPQKQRLFTDFVNIDFSTVSANFLSDIVKEVFGNAM